MARAAAEEKRSGLFVPPANAAVVVEGIDVTLVGSLTKEVGFLLGRVDCEPKNVELAEVFGRHAHPEEELVDDEGQNHA